MRLGKGRSWLSVKEKVALSDGQVAVTDSVACSES